MIRNVIFILTIGCFLALNGCAGNVNEETTVSNRNEQVDGTEAPVAEEQEKEISQEGVEGQMKEFVTAEEFKKYYSMEEGSVSDEYLESFIIRRELTEEELSKRNYDVMVKKLYDRGIVYEAGIYTLISGEKVTGAEYMELEKMSHLIMINDLSIDGTDLKTPEYIVLDVDKKKLYLSHNDITSNYESAESVVEIEDAWMQECMVDIRDILVGEKVRNNEETEILDWHLYFVQKDKKVAMYSGTMFSGERIHGWYQGLLEESSVNN